MMKRPKKEPPKPRAASVNSDSSSLPDPDDKFHKADGKSMDEDNPDGEEDLDVTGMTEPDI